MPDEETATDGTELIDATQNTVIQAVDNLSEMIAETSEFSDETAEHEIFYQSAEFWVGFAFILVIVFLAKPVGKALKAMLLKRSESISDKINEAQKLRDEAQVLLADYERKYCSSDQEAQNILTSAQKEIENLANFELAELEKNLAAQKKQTEREIEAEIEKTRSEIKSYAVSQALEIVASYLEQTDEKTRSKMIDESIQNIFSDKI